MHKSVTFILVCTLVGCAGSPPKPPKCVGEFRPVNAPSENIARAGNNEALSLCTAGGVDGHRG